MAEIKISKHAKEQMDERGISEEMLMNIIVSPQQSIPDEPEKMIYQSVEYFAEDKREFLVRVFVNTIKQPNLVITVYRTSKIKKYWKDEN